MRKEIDILRKAAFKNCAVVEKSTNKAWSEEDLQEAAQEELFPEEDRLLPPDDQPVITSPFPGCIQMPGSWKYRLVGQTKHFVIFHEVRR